LIKSCSGTHRISKKPNLPTDPLAFGSDVSSVEQQITAHSGT